MTFRCGGCHGAVWFQAQPQQGAATCGNCGQAYSIDLHKPGRSLAVRARRLARLNSIDLPGAYSLLLGIMTVEELRELGDSGSTPCRTAPVDDPGPQRYDRAFQPAIDEGLLTPRQAAERGKRDACAAILAAKHKLGSETAYAVADNRISLLGALRDRGARTESARRPVVQAGRVRRIVGLTATLIAVALVGVLMRRPGAAPVVALTAGRVIGDAEVQIDDGGRIVQVRGPDPASVLRAYCDAASAASKLEPLGVVPAELQDGRVSRLGLLRDPERPAMVYAIVIREELETGRWLAGGGEKPLIARPAPRGAEQVVHRR